MKVSEFNEQVNAEIAHRMAIAEIDCRIAEAREEVEAARRESGGRNVELWMANCRYCDLLAKRIQIKRGEA